MVMETEGNGPLEDWRNGGFGLYVHWPFCQSKCPYCDFNSHVTDRIEADRWQSAYLAEIERLGAQTPNRVLGTIYFGGGTPSLMTPETVATIIAKVRSTWPMENDPEISLEANPGSVEAGKFRAFHEAGVNRVSMGMQAMNDRDLQRLGRLHTVAEAKRAYEVARAIFDRVNFDLIYARQDQSLSDWRTELTEALSLAVDHLSLYQLTVEEGTAFWQRRAAGGLSGLPDEDLAADMYNLTQDLCDHAGFPGYEISNHARPGSESRHNLVYWRGGDYAGIGPGAHGRLTLGGERFATECLRVPMAWLEAVETAGTGETARAGLASEEQALEYLLMSIRLTEGMEIDRFEKRAGKSLSEAAVAELEQLGLVHVTADRIGATAKGRPLLNAIILKLASA